MKNIVDLFIKLVKIGSPSGKEEKMRDFLINWFKKRKVEFQVDQVGNLLAKIKGKGEPLLLSAHMDTVEPCFNIKPIIQDNYLKSSGETILGADNKAAIAAILSFVDEMIKKKNLVNLDLLFTVKEETGGGVEHFPFSFLRAKKGFVFDAAYPLGGIVLASPFIENFHMAIIGQASHASQPEKGLNSLIPFKELIKKIKLGFYQGKDTTLNIGRIQSGTSLNTIPEKTVVSGEIRSYENEKFLMVKDNLKKTIQVLRKKYEKYQINLSFSGFCPGYRYQKDDPFIKKTKKILKKVLGKSYFLKSRGVSDVNIFYQKKLKVLNLTDGVEEPHTLKEKIKIDNLLKLKEIIENLV